MTAPLLFSPFPVRELTLKNRLWVSPMCQYQADGDGVMTDWHLLHLGALARGGAGLVMVEATGVLPEGRITPRCLGLWGAAQEEALARVVAVMHAQGAAVGVQLAHAGRKASTHPWLPGEPDGSVPLADGGWPTVAPSALPFGDFAAPAALDAAGIDRVVAGFVAAAGRAVAAGVDVLEVHAAHGYLLHQFLSPLSNRRDDEHGGPLENRARLLLRVVAAVRAAHPGTPVFVRVSASEWAEGGFSPEEAATVAGWLAGAGADLVDVSSGGNLPAAAIPVGPGYQVPLAARLRAAGLPVAAVGLIDSPEQAETVLRTGQADAVFVGRPALGDPHLPLRWAARLRADGVRPPASYWRAAL